MKIIGINDEIFKTKEYLDDKYLFAIFEKKIRNENAKIMSDGKNYIIVNESEDRAPWIWTKNNFDKSCLKEIEEVMKQYMVKEKIPFTCKKELYEALLNDGFCIDKSDYFELGFMKCEKLKNAKVNDGVLSRATLEDRDIIAKYIGTFNNSMDASARSYNPTSEEDMIKYSYERADEELINEKFYVLRNANNKIVSMAHYKVEDNGTAKVGLVYTPDEERGRGYAAKIVHDITAILLEKGYIPLLYTDQNYPSSNKAYANVGYENKGTLINFSCDKK